MISTCSPDTDFNPRSPHGERPRERGSAAWNTDFNPRSPHGERRGLHFAAQILDLNFNPRSPHGERRRARISRNCTGEFQSTLSSRRATTPAAISGLFARISIHALLTESDDDPVARVGNGDISIHALLTESDKSQASTDDIFSISIHALLTESDNFSLKKLRTVEISIHALLTESDVAALVTGIITL